ncbi:MAG: hypothetical protein JW915_23570 [Chitinispirillaceae bacterium]|nr:hypothetical protein [Chitinispirillaceae bacterium]MBN2771416.1 hypothetical protein [Spirochaetota bacterium]
MNNHQAALLHKTVSCFCYCPGPEKRQLSIEVCYEDKIVIKALTFMLEQDLRRIEYGLGAGSMFSPAVGTWKFIRKPEPINSDTASFLIEVSSVTPEFWISIACFLSSGFTSLSNNYICSRSVSITEATSCGSELHNKEWLIKTCNAPRFTHYEPLPFSLELTDRIIQNLTVQIILKKEVDDTLMELFQNYMNAVQGHIAWLMDDELWFEYVPVNIKNEINICIKNVPDPGQQKLLMASLLNSLHCFHIKTAKIQSVTII